MPFQKSKRPFKVIEDFFAEHDGEFDILHCHPPFAPQFFGRAAKRHGVKRVIAHSHSTVFSDRKLSALRNRTLSKFLGLYATDYIACSEAARILLGRHGKDAFILHNAIDCDKYAFDPAVRDEVRSELAIGEDVMLIGSVGRLSVEKNQQFMLDVLDVLKRRGVSSKLAIAGGGNRRDELRSKARQLGLQDSLILLGNRADAERLYSAFDVFLLTSLFEGLPLSAVEAQACGLPCFLSDSITREVAIGNAVFISLEDGAEVWGRRRCFRRPIEGRCRYGRTANG